MLVTSFDCIKKRKFEIFSYTHLVYVVYLIALPLHGCMFLFNYGIKIFHILYRIYNVNIKKNLRISPIIAFFKLSCVLAD